MHARPLVNVLTPTWQRHELLMGCIENVRIQTYRPLEHVIVSDGPDAPLSTRVHAEADRDYWDHEHDGRHVPIAFVDLGRNWSTFLPNAYCYAPVTVATFLATGDYHLWLADDERMDPDHIESLVTALETTGADFAYSKVEMSWYDNRSAPWVIGTDPPQLGQITNCLYRADLLKHGLYVHGDDRASDWATIEQWIAAGATWAFTGRETMTHRADR